MQIPWPHLQGLFGGVAEGHIHFIPAAWPEEGKGWTVKETVNHLRQQVRPCCPGSQARPYECYAPCIPLLPTDPPTPTPGKTGAGGNIALSIRKANKYSWIREKLFYPTQVPEWG